MTYKEALTDAMTLLSQCADTRFIGYNVRYGSKANGTLAHVPESQLVETPVAENLVAGLAMGYALRGHTTVTWIERFDFMLNAADAIVNHSAKMYNMSGGQFKPHVIFRTIVGGKAKPLFTGATHVQDFSEQFAAMADMPVVQLRHLRADAIQRAYRRAYLDLHVTSTIIVEYRDLYEMEVL